MQSKSVTRLYAASSPVASTPTLADDRWVLPAESGVLHQIDVQTRATQDVSLPVADEVRAGVVVSEYGVMHGTVITLRDTGLQGYGNAPWPRFRKGNFGSGQ